MTSRWIGLATLLAAAAGLFGAHAACAQPTVASPQLSTRLSIADSAAFQRHPPEILQKRFDIYRSLGIGMLRVSWGWRQLERSEGRWSQSESMRYLTSAKQAGFVFKMNLDDINAPPQWFITAHPEAQILASNGEHDNSDLSLWYPGLRPLLAAKMDMSVKMLMESGIFDVVRYIVIGLGPAGEPRYPAPWLPGKPHDNADLTFWYYDENARHDFISKMQKKYQEVTRANAAWGTTFAGWADVALPKSDAATRMWRDVLPWYRDSKREFITWQLHNVRATLEKYAAGRKIPQLMVFVIGAFVSDADWERAINGGHADFAMMIGADTGFMLDLAHREGLMIQETGGQSEKAVEEIRHYMSAHGYNIPMWIENSGGAAALAPQHLSDVVVRQGLQGLEYIESDNILQGDGITPTKTMPEFARAYGGLHSYFATHPGAP